MSSMPARIRRARALSGLSQAELARRVGVERSAVSQWETPAGTTPSSQHVADIAIAAGVCYEWLATGRGATQPEPGKFDQAVVEDDFARDALETRVLAAIRRLRPRRRQLAIQILELMAN